MESLLLTDPATGSLARIAPHRGFNCYKFDVQLGPRYVQVLDSDPGFAEGTGKPSGHGIPILFPFPNRIRDGRYTWRGRAYQIEHVPRDANGHSIHGFCLDRAWRVVDQSPSAATGEFRLSVDAPECLSGWPCDFVLRVHYRLAQTTLRMDIEVENPGETALPWGFGTHPYFRLPLATNSSPGQCLIEVPAREQWDLIDCLPTGTRQAVSPEKDLHEGEYFDVLKLDDVLTDLQSESGLIECRIMDERAGLQVVQRFPDDFREVVVYTPPSRPAVCLEPYTCVTDAIHLEQTGVSAGLQVLEPGDKFRTWIEISVEPVIA
jgi:aldose 1-epimerase